MKNILSWETYSTNFTTKYLNFFLLLATVGLFNSCGSRKTELSKTENKKDTLISIISEKKIKVDSSYTFDFSSFKIHPIDSTKPILINGNTILNAIIEGSTKKETGTLKKEGYKKNKEVKKGSQSNIAKAKKAEKKDHTILWALIAFIISGFIFLWFYLPKIKKG